MTGQIVGIAVNFIVTGLLGYSVSSIKNYKERLKKKEENETLQNEALKTLLQAQLTNTFFSYADREEIKDYVYRNWKNLFKIYKALGGNDYIGELSHRMESWKIIGTGILDK